MLATFYPYILTLHLFCAIFFVGFLFSDVVIISAVLRRLKPEMANEVRKILGSLETKIMPPCFLLLILSGGMLLSNYVGGDHGWWQSTFQKLLLLKVGVAGCIFLLVTFSLSMFFVFKKPNPLGKYTHPLVFTLACIIVVLAKFMYVF
ncbi:hypothetical protein [Helicobacter fennelliae]|uniref:Copper resistance protein D domain-containing protein n=2 Tax=Helicobacter fennelliae TaxID=215 RepID=T1DVC7_9HELI|nr:hypothetical protein [Helicobacter fennelliae]GAD18643.1 hypothetical protein HFN_2055 [Helicobacter fennelliae MRY12-0050]SQB97318.1 translocation protein, low temperature [Helicobacter fennelliae]STP07179.1 translocation protein, low temperature [Helicobacter fennelliae]STQ83273.1 translocation protein, low temperature [Helicobacter fennelliae]